ncbi:5'-3' exonuclease PLD3-like [Dendroctonus ponderosae]|uniref:5'-3' exonuclease PLD3-like n=1 Tax=Dendroctonus ponderosae TaxID=77166 RepID=UPI002034ECBD|nr:5'-3' exonuclease PLD3-like [Dendroctonus ponderosae]
MCYTFSFRWGGNNKWCRPSCIPITIICTLIFLVVLLPVLDHAAERALDQINSHDNNACNSCSLTLVESIPEGLIFNESSLVNPSTFDTWLNLINNAQQSIDIASLYWTLRQSEVYPDPSSIKGEKIFQALLKAGTDRGVTIRIAQNAPSRNYPNVDTEFLVKRKAAQVRSLNFAKLLGSGVLHTKLWIVDKKHLYVGSANMDWRSLTQVKELGIGIFNCSSIGEDALKIFEVSTCFETVLNSNFWCVKIVIIIRRRILLLLLTKDRVR